MPVWPKSILSLGASLLTARMAWRLRRRDRGLGGQRAAFSDLVRGLAAAKYWRGLGVVAPMPYQAFRTRVPVQTHETLAGMIGRMQQGEPDLLWPGRCTHFAASSGTTTGAPRIVPVTTRMLRHFSNGCRDGLLCYTARRGHAGVFRGRHLFLTGSTAMRPVQVGSNDSAFVGEWAAIAALNLRASVDHHLYEPGAAIGALSDWQAKAEAIINRDASRDISLVTGLPFWVLSFGEMLRDAFAQQGRPFENLQSLWPNLECCVHGGVSIGPYLQELRTLMGPDVQFHEMYAAVEGVFAAQDTAVAGELRLMTDLGVFYEFVPLAEFDETRLDVMAVRAVSIAQVKRGVDYVLLVTTPAGLARFIVGDIVRFVSTEPPRLMCVGRTPLLLGAFGERVIEKEVTDALASVCRRHNWQIVNFHVAPLLGSNLTGAARGRHEWWVELKPGTRETPTGPQMAIELDAELQRLNRDYGARRTSGKIDAPTVRLVMPGVFKHWLRYHGRWDGQTKITRCRSDRLVADDLAQITRFAHD